MSTRRYAAGRSAASPEPPVHRRPSLVGRDPGNRDQAAVSALEAQRVGQLELGRELHERAFGRGAVGVGLDLEGEDVGQGLQRITGDWVGDGIGGRVGDRRRAERPIPLVGSTFPSLDPGRRRSSVVSSSSGVAGGPGLRARGGREGDRHRGQRAREAGEHLGQAVLEVGGGGEDRGGDRRPPPRGGRSGPGRRRSASCRAARPCRCGSRAGCSRPRRAERADAPAGVELLVEQALGGRGGLGVVEDPRPQQVADVGGQAVDLALVAVERERVAAALGHPEVAAGSARAAPPARPSSVAASGVVVPDLAGQARARRWAS